MCEALIQVLQFLSSDAYRFDFQPMTEEQPRQQYLELGDQEDWPFHNVERVVMFSGGLDSLAGAVETASGGGKLVLVSHRSVATLDKRQRELFNAMRRTFNVPMIHIPVWVNKEERLSREYTQRTRSFLYAVLGTVVAQSVQAEGVRFFENGIVSLNLPVADEVLRSRASRTTHPQSLVLLSRFLSLVVGHDVAVDNPFIYKTKTDIVSLIARHQASELIRYTCSCAHTGFFQSKTQWHCGTCSQCIDRRVAIISAGQDTFDSETDYVSDVFTGPRKEGHERNIAVDYVRHSFELYRMSELEIATEFNLHLSRAVRFEPRKSEATQKLIEMHKRHGETVHDVVVQQLKQHAIARADGSLCETSLLALTFGQKHLQPSWKRFSDRIAELLKAGIPVACSTEKPENELRLQELCDGILRAQNNDLTREYPFMRWSSSMTKPDWSIESLQLWVEMKYVRQKPDIRETNEAIAADITKYGDNERRVLYVVYDPHHLILDEQEFSQQIVTRSTMTVEFIR